MINKTERKKRLPFVLSRCFMEYISANLASALVQTRLLLSRLEGESKNPRIDDSLLAVDDQHSVFKSAFPLILDSLHLFIHAQHYVAH